MRNTFEKTLIILILLAMGIMNSPGQTGGTFDLSRSVIASGGGIAAGQSVLVNGTMGQPVAGQVSSNSQYSLTSGFWVDATGSITGRVTSSQSRGIRNARMTLTNEAGEVRTAISGPLGMYKFLEVPLGQTYTLRVQARRFTFADPERKITLDGNLSDINFTAQ